MFSTPPPVAGPGILVALKRAAPDKRTWDSVGSGITDANGRIASCSTPLKLCKQGIYQLIFHVADYFEDPDHFLPRDRHSVPGTRSLCHYHVPLLLSPYGYTTYRGS